ncbi:MAG: hypothetical protein A3F35_01925 [Candidatus Woykebacteria bacterium RIFCSPHIGHO2_12_FULL_45_10]|uniref:DUF1761 domain-containing protein n=1 Tax=Candidatus Woykebacteria bacterium RIFCSPHIGHO2_12_FULL_45_10 TaxID=1802603 RepID=A0A1G1WP41_9BACT|nr:MAG: hypothetical protein A3F35_01925 [Candidatus Woykebacteria bacterium RIFCSPHIGHO2_12_FULL_45_10]
MEARILRAGIGATAVGLIAGGALGSYGGWAPLLALSNNYLGVWVIAATLGVFLAYLYANWFDALLPGTTAVRGAIFGALVWVLLLILGGVSSFFKEAVYPDPAGSSLFLSLVLHLVWGSILGLIYEVKP